VKRVPSIWIIVPVHRKVAATATFIACVRRHVPSATVVVVDDDADGSCTRAFRGERGVVVLPGDGSLWWGGAVNRAIGWLADEARPRDDDLVVFANNDVTFDTPILEKLLPFVDSRRIAHPDVVDTAGRRIGAGRRLASWFPYVTRGPACRSEVSRIDLATARFLCMTWSVLCRVGPIHRLLPHYQGDNEFSLRAIRKGVRTVQVNGVRCVVDETATGAKNSNLDSIGGFLRSLTSIRSANNLLYRYRFAMANVGPALAVPVVASMTFNSLVKTFLNITRSALRRPLA
jgi:GT2 family glycosyltransferase